MKYSFYIYYKVPEQNATSLYGQIRTLQNNIKDKTGITGKLLKKVNDSLLWMEIYENVNDPTTFLNTLQKEISNIELADFFEETQRKVEIFSE